MNNILSKLQTQSYAVSYIYETSPTDDFIITSNASCVTEACEYIIDVPQSLCNSSANAISINTTVSAINHLGTGPPSEYITAGTVTIIIIVYYDTLTQDTFIVIVH